LKDTNLASSASRTGDAVGGLLNATFGNAPELIISMVALRAGLFDMVRASLIGAMVSGDGRSNWYKGGQFITVYVIMGLLFYWFFRDWCEKESTTEVQSSQSSDNFLSKNSFLCVLRASAVQFPSPDSHESLKNHFYLMPEAAPR
jgi:Ca2+/Na+ antiporter